jgi:5-oxoprolinase (ATP-hydrolysing)
LIHKYCGILSAYGLGLADVVEDREEPLTEELNDHVIKVSQSKFSELKEANIINLKVLGFKDEDIEHTTYLNLRYAGTDTQLMIETPNDNDYKIKFEDLHRREFGFILSGRKLYVDNVRVRSVGKN